MIEASLLASKAGIGLDAVIIITRMFYVPTMHQRRVCAGADYTPAEDYLRKKKKTLYIYILLKLHFY